VPARSDQAQLRDSVRELVTGWTWLLIPGMVLLLLTVPAMLGHLGVPYVATTDRVLAILRGPANDLRILIVLLAGELVRRERDVNLQSLTDAAPVPDAVWFIGKLLGLWGVTVALHVVLVAAPIPLRPRRMVVALPQLWPPPANAAGQRPALAHGHAVMSVGSCCSRCR